MTVKDVLWMNASAGQPDYSAADFRLALSALAGHTGTTRLLGARSGVVPGVASALQVTHDGATPGQVTVAVGQAWIDATLSLGAYLVTVEVAETKLVPAAGTVTRTDRVIVRARDAEVDATVGTDRKGTVEYLAGDAGTGAPLAVPDHALLLAEVTVPVTGTPSVADKRTYQARTDSFGRPVKDQAEQDGITTKYAGQALYRRDTGHVEVWNGTAWKTFAPVGDPWQSYTPTLTNWTKGNATLTGRVMQAGKLVTFSISFTIGSTTVPSGQLQISLPVNSFLTNVACGTAAINDASAGKFMRIAHIVGSNRLQFFDQGGTAATDTIPITWATGDDLIMYGTYEAA